MLEWQALVQLSDADVARLDVAAVNLACAVDLPHSKPINEIQCLRTLDRWAEKCMRFTQNALPMFYSGKNDYPESESKFRIQGMITHLQRDLGVRYHPGRIAKDAIFQPEDSFINGAIQGAGGTCASMPVVYASVGRRMGYPIRLATTRGHLFCRWQSSTERFNIEATGQGIDYFADDYYRTGHYQLDAREKRDFGYIDTLSPREELASFLMQRGECWMQEKNFRQAVVSFAWANELDSRRKQHQMMTWQAMCKWNESLQLRLPQKFPRLKLSLAESRFLKLHPEMERRLVGLQATDDLLKDPILDQRWWTPMRQSPDKLPETMPTVLHIEYKWNELARPYNLSL